MRKMKTKSCGASPRPCWSSLACGVWPAVRCPRSSGRNPLACLCWMPEGYGGRQKKTQLLLLKNHFKNPATIHILLSENLINMDVLFHTVPMWLKRPYSKGQCDRRNISSHPEWLLTLTNTCERYIKLSPAFACYTQTEVLSSWALQNILGTLRFVQEAVFVGNSSSHTLRLY